MELAVKLVPEEGGVEPGLFIARLFGKIRTQAKWLFPGEPGALLLPRYTEGVSFYTPKRELPPPLHPAATAGGRC